jgi:hypothetical protein
VNEKQQAIVQKLLPPGEITKYKIKELCLWVLKQKWDDLDIPYAHIVFQAGWDPEYLYDASENSIHRWLGAALDGRVLEWWCQQIKAKRYAKLPDINKWHKWFCAAYGEEVMEDWPGKHSVYRLWNDC